MDALFIEGVAATVSAIIIFCGSVTLLLTMVVGFRLAYLITACITLGFLFIMGLVWAFTNPISPLGPVGTLPSWDDVAISEDQADLEFGAAEQYPKEPWRVPDEEDEAEVTQASELESDALEFLQQAIEEGEVKVFTASSQAIVSEESTRILEQDDAEYGALTFEPVPLVEPTPSETNNAEIGAGGGGGEASPSPSPSPTGPRRRPRMPAPT